MIRRFARGAHAAAGLVIALLILAGLGACARGGGNRPATTAPAQPPSANTAAPANTSTAGADVISKVVLATGAQGDNYEPTGVTNNFAPDATIHAVVTIANAPDNTSIGAVWFVQDVGNAASPNSMIDQYSLTTNGSRNLDFTLKPKTTWPEGTYRVEIQVNGKTVTTQTFTVKAS